MDWGDFFLPFNNNKQKSLCSLAVQPQDNRQQGKIQNCASVLIKGKERSWKHLKVFHKTRFTGQTTDVKDPFALEKKNPKTKTIENPEKQLQKVGYKIFISLLEQTSKTKLSTQPNQSSMTKSFTHTPTAMPGPCNRRSHGSALFSLLSLSHPQPPCLCLPSPFSDPCRSPQLLFFNPEAPWMFFSNQNLNCPKLHATPHPSLGPKALWL